VKPEREFFLSAGLGADLSGAVIVDPINGSNHDDRQHQHDDEDQQQKGVLRFSFAGVQLKFSAVMEAAGGLTVPAHGVGRRGFSNCRQHGTPAVPKNEYVMLELARAIGITSRERGLCPSRMSKDSSGRGALSRAGVRH